MKSVSIRFINITKSFHNLRRGKIEALKKIHLKIKKGEFFVILGPSGCGKSTLLNIIAGLEQPDSGEIYFDNTPVFSVEKKLHLLPKERNIAMVFQSYALYPHLNVYKNMAFPLKIEKRTKTEIDKKIQETAEMLDITNLLNAKPGELSGGQQQRVAIARALVREPSVLLLDEPLSNLDAQLRTRMREELKNLQQQLKLTTVYVTHDQVEAMTLGDCIMVMEKGEILQTGPPMDVYKNPGNSFVAGFLGTPSMNFLKATVARENSGWVCLNENIKIKIPITKYPHLPRYDNKKIIIGIRPEDILINDKPDDSGNSLNAEVTFAEHLGAETILHAQVNKEKVIIKVQQEKELSERRHIRIHIDPELIHIFDEAGNNILNINTVRGI